MINASDAVLIAALAAAAPTIIAAASLVQAIKTHKAVNSRMDELLALAKKEASAAGALGERQAEQVRKGEAALTEKERDATVIR